MDGHFLSAKAFQNLRDLKKTWLANFDLMIVFVTNLSFMRSKFKKAWLANFDLMMEVSTFWSKLWKYYFKFWSHEGIQFWPYDCNFDSQEKLQFLSHEIWPYTESWIFSRIKSQNFGTRMYQIVSRYQNW